jgi:hypothetical protein
MRVVLSLLGLAVIAGCAPDLEREPPPLPMTLDELAVDVDSASRGFFLSDRTGGFVTGTISAGAPTVELSWGAWGTEILHSLALREEPSGKALEVAGGRILPSHARIRFAGGTELEIEPLETAREDVHALLLVATTGSNALVPQFVTPPGFRAPQSLAGQGGLFWRGERGTLVLYGDVSREEGAPGLLLPGTGVRRFLLCYSAGNRGAEATARELFAHMDSLREARHERLVALLNRGLLRTSDVLLTRAANWFKLSLDALVLEGRDTMIVGSVPWDGSFDLRAAAQSLTGLELATAGRGIAPSILRSAARWQDTVRSSPTFGRLPVEVSASGPRYGAADVTAWLIREEYEHVARSADTVLVHLLYPVAKRSIEGTRSHDVDSRGLLRHGPGETWVSASGGAPRGRADRAIEVQTLWYYEQMIGSFLAAFLGHSETSNAWAASAETTQVAVTELFMDTTSMRMIDHLRPDGTPSADVTPNGLFAFELTPSELFRQETIESLVGSLVSPYGVSARVGGPVWPWLTGQIVYVLTRYDHQNTSYRITDWMMRSAMERDMVGVLPERYVAATAAAEARPDGRPVCGPGMGEFLRALYQDYFGIGIDALSRQITLMPKLPSEITEVDATVEVGSSLVRVRYEVGPTTSRVILTRSGGEQELKVGFIWMLPDGDAWRGSAALANDGELRLIFSADDAVAYRNGAEEEIAGKWKLQNFSRRGELSGLRLAGASSP